MIVGSDPSQFVVSACLCRTQRFVPHPIQSDRATRDTTSVGFKRRNPVAPHRPARGPQASRLAVRANPSELPVKSSLVWVLVLCCVGLSGVSSGPATAEEPEGRGFISSVLEWFRGEEETSPEPDTGPSDNAEGISTTHVYQAATELLAEIKVLRRATRVTDAPPAAEVISCQTLTHVYTKALEVQVKTGRLQKRFGMIPVEVASIPVKDITARDLHSNIMDTIHELRRVKRQLVIDEEIQPDSFSGRMTPSLICQTLANASLLVDGLLGRSTTFNDIYMHVLRVHDEMELISEKQKVTLKLEPPIVNVSKETKDVAQQVLRASYKVVQLQKKLDMILADTPTTSLERVTVTDVYYATARLLAEMVRIKVNLNIQTLPATPRTSRNKQPTDVFAQVLLLIHNLDLMIEAVEAPG